MSKKSMLSNLFAIAMFCILVTWFQELVPLNFVIFLLVVSNVFLILQTNKIETTAVSRNYRFSRTYNQFGEVVGTRWTEVVEDGYWVTIVTDKDMNLYAEHTRSDENAENHISLNTVKQEDMKIVGHENGCDVVEIDGVKHYVGSPYSVPHGAKLQ